MIFASICDAWRKDTFDSVASSAAAAAQGQRIFSPVRVGNRCHGGQQEFRAFIRHQARVPGPIIGFVVNDKGPMVDFFLKESKKSKIKK